MKEKSYAELKLELEELKQRTEKARLAEIEAVAIRAAEMLNQHQITLADLRTAGYRPSDDVGRKVGRPKRSASTADPKSPVARAVQYRDPGNPANTWGGRGARPKWIREALAAGQQLESFRVA